MNTEGHKEGCMCISCLVERSSLGTPEAKKLRASVSDEQVARVVQRAAELDTTACERCLRLGCRGECAFPPSEKEDGSAHMLLVSVALFLWSVILAVVVVLLIGGPAAGYFNDLKSVFSG